jgi:hypothetical protein
LANPCDRFIIAAAKLHDLTVVTRDEQFEQYGLPVLSGTSSVRPDVAGVWNATGHALYRIPHAAEARSTGYG